MTFLVGKKKSVKWHGPVGEEKERERHREIIWLAQRESEKLEKWRKGKERKIIPVFSVTEKDPAKRVGIEYVPKECVAAHKAYRQRMSTSANHEITSPIAWGN